MIPNKFNIKDKFVLITGSAGLLGKEHAKAVLEIGGNVILTDINIESLEHQYKSLKENYKTSKILYFELDVTKEKKVVELSEILLKNHNIVIDILINNAAIDHKIKKDGFSKNESNRLEDFSLEKWNNEIKVGLTGAFLTSKIFGNLMFLKRNKTGVIINIASDLSVISPNQKIYQKEGLELGDQAVKPITYSVIKSGLVGMTKYLATYWLNGNIRCNSLSPGGVYVDQDMEFVEKISEHIPLGRMAKLNEYHSAIQFLISDASSYLNGHNLVIDGGRSIW